MNKHVERLLMLICGIISGFTFCGILVGKIAMKSEHIRKGIIDSISDKVTVLLYGEDAGTRTQRRTYVSYADYYNRNSKESFRIESVIFDTRSDAEKVLDALKKVLSDYGVVSVHDYYDMVDVTGNYKANCYGWTNLNNAKVQRVTNGYILNFPLNKKIA